MADIRVIVADDEPVARHGLTRMLAAHADVAVVSESRNGGEAVRAIRTLRPDLVFLDIRMPELDGFEVLRAVAPEPLPLVVFITAFDDYAVRAFDVHAIDYLVKPFSDDRFADMLSRVRRQLQQSAAVAAAQRLAALLAGKPGEPGGGEPIDGAASVGPRPSDRSGKPADEVLIATTGRRSVVIAIHDIDWIEAQDYCVLVHTGRTSHLLRESIRTLEHRLAARQFTRIHRSALVNLARVRELRRPPHGEWLLVLASGVELPVSRRQRPAVTRHFAPRT